MLKHLYELLNLVYFRGSCASNANERSIDLKLQCTFFLGNVLGEYGNARGTHIIPLCE